MKCPRCKGLGGGYETCYGYYPDITYDYVEIGDCRHCNGTGEIQVDHLGKLQFKREYLCSWIEPDPKYEFAFRKWLEYYHQTEVYDRGVCSGIDERTGNAVPRSTVEYININRMNKIILEIRDKEIDDDTWRSAREAASKYSHSEAEELLIRLGRQ